jgi:hypothetical protein
MNRNRLMFLAGMLVLASLVFATASDAWAQRGGTGVGTSGQGFQYVIKFICGEVTDVDSSGEGLVNGNSLATSYGEGFAVGEYFTVINIHNPNEATARYGVEWFKKVVLDYYVVQSGADSGQPRPRFVAQRPTGAINQKFWITQDTLGETRGSFTPPRDSIRDFTLSRDEAAQANCHELRHVTQDIDNSFDNDDLIKGFVVIYSKIQLDITAIYTACDAERIGTLDCEDGGDRGVTTLKYVRIIPNGITPPRLDIDRNGQPDLPTSFPQTTGTADCPATGCQYVVKFVCGEIQSATTTFIDSELESELSPGEYYTDINIHNPNGQPINVNKKFTADDPIPEVHGPLTSPENVRLEVDDAININCRDIRHSALNKPFPQILFFKGFVILYTRAKLDIVAMYTACPQNAIKLNCIMATESESASGPPGGTPGTNDHGVKSWEVKYFGPNDFTVPTVPPTGVLPPVVAAVGLSLQFDLNRSLRGVSLPLESVQLQVYALNGKELYSTGFVRSTTLSWRPMLNDRPLANGVYLYVVTMKDVLGNVVRRVGKFAYLREQ